VSTIEDGIKNRMYDTLEECVLDIEELKDELAMIQMTQTASGKDKWDTPEVIVAAGKKSKMRKDRYSSLLMANMAARIISRTPEQELYEFYGGFATTHKKKTKKDSGKLYNAPAWFTDNIQDAY
jgi:hypothetical protein